MKIKSYILCLVLGLVLCACGGSVDSENFSPEVFIEDMEDLGGHKIKTKEDLYFIYMENIEEVYVAEHFDSAVRSTFTIMDCDDEQDAIDMMAGVYGIDISEEGDDAFRSDYGLTVKQCKDYKLYYIPTPTEDYDFIYILGDIIVHMEADVNTVDRNVDYLVKWGLFNEKDNPYK